MIITRSPLRITLGGGTDLPSYYREHGGYLIAAAIDSMSMYRDAPVRRGHLLKLTRNSNTSDPRGPAPDHPRGASHAGLPTPWWRSRRSRMSLPGPVLIVWQFSTALLKALRASQAAAPPGRSG